MSDHEGKKEIDEKTVCANCNIMVEESLMLTCDHNLCLLCGSENLKREQRKSNHKYHVRLNHLFHFQIFFAKIKNKLIFYI